MRLVGILLISVAMAGCFGPPDLVDLGSRELRLADAFSRAAMRIDVGGELGDDTVVVVDDVRRPDEIPVATIRDDTRLVLAVPTKHWLHVQSGVEIPSDGILELSPGYSPVLPRAQSLLVVPRAKLDGEWRDLPDQVVAIARRGDDDVVEFKLDFGAARAGELADIHVDAVVLSWGAEQSYETGVVQIGPNDRLDTAFGILDEARDNGRVRFSIEWCGSKQCTEVFAETVDPADSAARGWIDRSIALDAYAGLAGRIVFKSALIDSKDAAYSFPVWANPTIVRPDKPAPGPRNVILLSIDTLRADHLTSYGYEHDTSPFMDRTFAKQGTVFDNMVASASSTSPAHMTMFTGVQASVHGLTKGLEGLAPWIETFTESIRDAGYETGAVTEDGWLGRRHGFARGFNTYVENRSPNIMAPTGQVDVTFDRAKRWLERHSDRRFFLFLHTFQVHDPFSPPPAYQGLFHDRDSDDRENDVWHRRWLTAYDQEIRYTDDQLAALWSKVEELGLADDTILMITSDHGEGFMEHGYFGHGAHLHEAVVSVPLIVRGPGIAAGRRIQDLVGHVDLAPTILDLMGVEPLERQQQGRSLLPYLSGAAAAAGAPEDDSDCVYFTESWAPQVRIDEHRFERFVPPAFGVRRGSLKLARYKTAEGYRLEAFDLATDPEERSNLWPMQAERFSELAGLLQSYEAAMHELRRRLEGGDSATPRDGKSTAPDAIGLDPAQEEKLRALGYLN